MNTLSWRVFVAAGALVACASACERRDTTDRDASPAVDASKPATSSPSTTGAPAKRNIGEGERESAPWSTTTSSGAAIDARDVIEQFQTDIANDPAIAAVSNVSLILTMTGDLVLQGTAESDDVKDELEDYAEKLAGRDVDNQIEVADH
jgi:hypothetical protein